MLDIVIYQVEKNRCQLTACMLVKKTPLSLSGQEAAIQVFAFASSGLLHMQDWNKGKEEKEEN